MRILIKKFKMLSTINKLFNARKAILEEAAYKDFDGVYGGYLLDLDTRIKKYIEALQNMYEKL